MTSTLTSLALYKHSVVTTDSVKNEPQVGRDLTYARRNFTGITSAKDLLANPRLLRIVTTAFGVKGYSTADLQKALASDVVPTGVPLTSQITADVNAFIGLDANGEDTGGGMPAVTSASELLADETLSRVFITAFGLQDYADRPDDLAALLEGDTYLNTSPLVQKGDPDLLAAARTFQKIVMAGTDPSTYEDRDALLKTVSERYTTAMIAAAGTAPEGSALAEFDDPALTEMVATLAFTGSGTKGLSDSTTVESILSGYVDGVRAEEQAAADAKATGYGRALAAIGKDPMTKREVDYFKANIGTITSVDGLMKNDRLYRFVLESFGLESEVNSRALIRKVLEGGVTDKNSMANRMNNRQFKEMASTLRIAEDQGATLKEPATVDAIVNRLIQVRMEKKAGEQNEAVRLALNFQRVAPTLNNWYDVMGDKALSAVVRTAFDLPDQVAQLDVDRQKDIYEKKIPFKDLKDPEKVQKLMNRFAVMYDIKNGTGGSATSSVVSTLFASSGSTSVVSIDPAITAMLSSYPRF